MAATNLNSHMPTEDDQTLNIRPSSVYLVARRYPVDDVLQVADHLLLPEVSRERLRPLRQQLQDFGAKLAHPRLSLRGNTPSYRSTAAATVC